MQHKVCYVSVPTYFCFIRKSTWTKALALFHLDFKSSAESQPLKISKMNILSCKKVDSVEILKNLRTHRFFFLKKCCNDFLTSLRYMRFTRPTQPSVLLDFRPFPSFLGTQRQIIYVHTVHVCMHTPHTQTHMLQVVFS